MTGTNLLVPRVLLSDSDSTVMTSSMVSDLAKQMSTLDIDSFSLGKSHSFKQSYMPKNLRTCADVWVRVDRVRKPLEAPYTGPFKVLRRSNKHFTIQLPNNVQTNVSIDRLKPCVMPVLSKELESETSTPLTGVDPVPCAEIGGIPKSADVPESPSDFTKLSDCVSDNRPYACSSTTRSGRRIRWKRDPSFHYYN